MEELVEVLQDILCELRDMNSKLDDIKGYGMNDSLSDIYDKLEDISDSL